MHLLPIAALLTSTFFLMAGAGLMGILLPVRGSKLRFCLASSARASVTSSSPGV